MKKLKFLLKRAKNTAFAAFLAGSIYFAGCDNPVEPKPVPEPPKPNPTISLNAELVNDVDLKYAVNLKNLNDARITISRNGNSVAYRMITDSIYSETLSYSTNKNVIKGNYLFNLEGKSLSGRDTSISANVTIPNYAPEINLSGISANMNEGSETNINLEGRLSDKNPEDNPISVANASSLD